MLPKPLLMAGTYAHRLLSRGEPTTANKQLIFTNPGTHALLKRC